MSEELKTCPFCGCLAMAHEHGGIFRSGSGHRVECEGACHAMTCYWHTAEQAIEAWNMRYDDRKPSFFELLAQKGKEQG